MSVDRYMKEHTIRQHKAYMMWLQMQWNRPDRQCYYLMQIALEIRRVLSKKPNAHKLRQLKLDFKGSISKEDQNPEKKAKVSKASWFRFLKIKPSDRANREPNGTVQSDNSPNR